MLTRLRDSIAGGIATSRELLGTLTKKKRNRRFLILLPFFLVISMLLAIVASSGALAPFVYPLF